MPGDEFAPIYGQTPIDTSELVPKLKGIVQNRADLNRVESENIRIVVNKYLATTPSESKAPFHYPWCLKVHQEMYCHVWQFAGKQRTENLNIGDPFYIITERLQGLLNDLEGWVEYKLSTTEQAVHFHHRSVKIHPFRDGNGRWSRMLANIWLKRHREPIVNWPTVVAEESPVRKEYIEAIKTTDIGDYGPLTELHLRFSGSS